MESRGRLDISIVVNLFCSKTLYWSTGDIVQNLSHLSTASTFLSHKLILKDEVHLVHSQPGNLIELTFSRSIRMRVRCLPRDHFLLPPRGPTFTYTPQSAFPACWAAFLRSAIASANWCWLWSSEWLVRNALMRQSTELVATSLLKSMAERETGGEIPPKPSF